MTRLVYGQDSERSRRPTSVQDCVERLGLAESQVARTLGVNMATKDGDDAKLGVNTRLLYRPWPQHLSCNMDDCSGAASLINVFRR